MEKTVAFQDEFRQALPNVTGNVDYETFRSTLQRISELIKLSKIEHKVMIEAVRVGQEESDQRRIGSGKKPKKLKEKTKIRLQKMAREALRCSIARHLTGEAFRVFSCRLADSALLQQFCLIDRLQEIKVPSKSKLQRYEGMFTEDFLRQIICEINQKAAMPADPEEQQQELGLSKPVSHKDYFVDTTCVKANIHFPVDWTLLRDATRTLMKAVHLIRREGLKNRMNNPEMFIGQMNRLCMQMSHTRRQKDGKRARKKIFRIMKKLVTKVARHAHVHSELLKSRREETCLSEAMAKQILQRIKSVLEQLPQAVKHAHERIIGGRQVKNCDKILSLYEQDIHVIVRGKANAETEFGNTLLLGEQRDGLILDYQLYQNQAPADSKTLKSSLERLGQHYNDYQPVSITGDRGFDSQTNRFLLAGKTIENHICPRSVTTLQEKLQDRSFCEHQKRRGQTEARIAILKNGFMGNPLRSKGFDSRQMNVSWAVLAHNFWVIARLPQAEQRSRQLSLAA